MRERVPSLYAPTLKSVCLFDLAQWWDHHLAAGANTRMVAGYAPCREDREKSGRVLLAILFCEMRPLQPGERGLHRVSDEHHRKGRRWTGDTSQGSAQDVGRVPQGGTRRGAYSLDSTTESIARFGANADLRSINLIGEPAAARTGENRDTGEPGHPLF